MSTRKRPRSSGHAAESRNEPPLPPMRRSLWFFTAAVSGAVVMSLEMAAFRLYAPYFGYSIYVWANMISIVMVALALGYALGGHIADRSKTDGPLFGLLLASALYQLLILTSLGRLMPALATLGEIKGTILASIIVFVPSMTLLASVGPFAVRLLARAGQVGSVAGRVSALSTIGSVAGIVITTFWLIPQIGTFKTLATACTVSGLLAALGLLSSRRALGALGVIPLLVSLISPTDLDWASDTLWSAESAYNLIQVREKGDQLWLTLNQHDVAQSIYNRKTGWSNTYRDAFALGPLLAPARRLLVLGLGGGASVFATRHAAPAVEIDAIEIDPLVAEAGIRFFGLSRDDPKLRIHVADARPWLFSSREHFDLVHVDLYQGGPYIPFYLVTEEFFRLISRRMTPDGLLMMNVLDLSSKRRLLNSTVATLRRVFPSVHGLLGRDGSNMLFAFTSERSLEKSRSELSGFRGSPLLESMAAGAAPALTELQHEANAIVLTDDRAPVEPMIHEMLAEARARVRNTR